VSKGSTIYARVEDNDKSFLKELASREQNWSENFIIERLIKYLREIDTIDKAQGTNLVRDILTDTKNNTFLITGEIMEGLAWGQHATNHKKISWIIEQYQKLGEISARAGAEGVWRFSQFQIAYHWMDNALKLRRLAIVSDTNWEELYAAADWSLRASIIFNELHSKGLSETNRKYFLHPAVTFNIACAWSLRAQYIVEKNLGVGSDIIKKIKEAIEIENKSLTQESIKQNNLDKWREILLSQDTKSGFFIESTVSKFAEKSIKIIQSLVQCTPDKPPTDPGFLASFAREDIDLLFVREDPKWGPIFDEILNISPINSALDEFSKLKSKISEEIVLQIEEI
jgi:hypothetical protein